jgi:hypothetical protein
MSLSTGLHQGVENLLRPEIQGMLSTQAQKLLQNAIAQGVSMVFWLSLMERIERNILLTN